MFVLNSRVFYIRWRIHHLYRSRQPLCLCHALESGATTCYLTKHIQILGSGSIGKWKVLLYFKYSNIRTDSGYLQTSPSPTTLPRLLYSSLERGLDSSFLNPEKLLPTLTSSPGKGYNACSTREWFMRSNFLTNLVMIESTIRWHLSRGVTLYVDGVAPDCAHREEAKEPGTSSAAAG